MNIKKNKKVLILNLNEANFDFILKYAKKYNNKNILEFLKNKKKIKTITKDLTQHKNLDPWVQEVSINTGRDSKKHKVFNLGDILSKNIPQIWDIISKKYKVLVWGSMNSQLRDNNNIKLFFPDPWNFTSKIKPKKLINFFLLPNYYAKNYTQPSLFKILHYSLKTLSVILTNIYFYKNLFKNFFFYITLIFSITSKLNYKLFVLFDILSLLTILKYEKKNLPAVSFIFLNSIAHFQHNNWNEKNNYKFFFQLLDILFCEINTLHQRYGISLTYNGFTQKRIQTEYLLRPLSPENFLKNINVKYYKLEQNMTNGGIIFFDNSIKCLKNFHIMKNYKICGYNLFILDKINDKSFFYKIGIKSLSKNLNPKNIKDKIKNYKKNYNKYKFNLDNYDLFEKMKFIKTTGVHVNHGLLLTHNLKKIKKNIIYNHEIFYILKNILNV
jgi:hypothetical protein